MEFQSFNEIVKFAISREEAAIEAYGAMGERARFPGLKELLLELQEEEKKHKQLLENISEGQIQALEIKKVTDLKISDYLTEEPPTDDMSFQDLLIIAAKKEQEAVELYTSLERSADDEELKKLFQFLIQQEKAHKLKLESEYEKHILEDD